MNTKELTQVLGSINDSYLCILDGALVALNSTGMLYAPWDLGVDAVVDLPLFKKAMSRWPTQEELTFHVDEELVVSGKKRKAGFALMDFKVTEHMQNMIQAVATVHTKPFTSEMALAMRVACSVAATDASYSALCCLHVSKEGFVESTNNVKAYRSDDLGFDTSFLVEASHVPKDIALFTEYAVLPETETLTGLLILHAPAHRLIRAVPIMDTAEYPDTSSIYSCDGDACTVSMAGIAAFILSRVDVVRAFSKDISISIQKDKLNIYGTGALGWYYETEDFDAEANGLHDLKMLLPFDVVKDVLAKAEDVLLYDGKFVAVVGGHKFVTAVL